MIQSPYIPDDPAIAVRRLGCRGCGASRSAFYSILDLGRLTPSGFPRPDDPDLPTVPLALVQCDSCGLVQLSYTVNPELLYRQTYWYRSGINETMRVELQDVMQAAIAIVGGISRADNVMDIGANDGTGLSCYRTVTQALLSTCPFRVAFEPAQALLPRLVEHADQVYHDFFPSTASAGLPAGSFKIITSIAMFYDLDDPRKFIYEIDRLLTDDGVWVVQLQDLAQMLECTAYDNVCFEHLTYYSLASFSKLLEDFDLTVVQAERRVINGGSLRIFVRRRRFRTYTPDAAFLEAPWLTDQALQQFAWRVGQHREQLQGLIGELQRQGTTIDLYAASTKANTLLQYCALDHTLIRQAVERTPEKVGRVTAGTRIPIVSEETWRADAAGVTLVGAWAFRNAFLDREAAYIRGGGSFVFPLPRVEVVGMLGGRGVMGVVA